MRARKKIDKANRRYKIYALIDPRDHAVRYVSISIDVDERFIGHLHNKNVAAPSKQWIQELHQEGLRPIMQILETIDVNLTEKDVRTIICERELFWIKEMQNRGHFLLNVHGISRPYYAAYFPSQKASKLPQEYEKSRPQENLAPALRPAFKKQRLKVREIAEKQGWALADLHRRTNVSKSALSGIWHDPYRRVSYEVLFKIARVLNVEVTDLVEEEAD